MNSEKLVDFFNDLLIWGIFFVDLFKETFKVH